MIDGRTLPLLVVLLGIGCATTIAAYRPLSDAAVAEVNESIEGRHASVVLAEEPERAVERERAAREAAVERERAARLACQSAPGQGSARFGEKCDNTRDCECGLTCPGGRCLGRSLKNLASASLTAPRPLEAKEVQVGRDTTHWLELRSGTSDEWRQSTVPTAALKSISVRRRGQGALEGLGLGLLVGALGGVAVGFAACGCQDEYRVPIALAGGALGGIGGIVVGTLIGAAISHRTVVEFDPP